MVNFKMSGTFGGTVYIISFREQSCCWKFKLLSLPIISVKNCASLLFNQMRERDGTWDGIFLRCVWHQKS